MALRWGATNTGSVRMSYIFVQKTACQKHFFQILSQKKRSDCESQNCESQHAGFGNDPNNPPRVWILLFHDPFLELPQKTHNPFLDSDIRIWIFPKKRIPGKLYSVIEDKKILHYSL